MRYFPAIEHISVVESHADDEPIRQGAARGYGTAAIPIDWKLELVAQLERDGTHRFRVI
jgi:hypothetical protein